LSHKNKIPYAANCLLLDTTGNSDKQPRNGKFLKCLVAKNLIITLGSYLNIRNTYGYEKWAFYFLILTDEHSREILFLIFEAFCAQ